MVGAARLALPPPPRARSPLRVLFVALSSSASQVGHTNPTAFAPQIATAACGCVVVQWYIGSGSAFAWLCGGGVDRFCL